jgi:glycosyltransferase involved in cell wall biosynthesis
LFEIHKLNLIFAKVKILRVLILYTELAGYVIGNIRRFLNQNPDSQFLVIHYPVNPEAPFNFSEVNNCDFVEFNQNTIQSTVSKFEANVVLCSGWSNKTYLHLVKQMDHKTKKVICFDNQWKGNLKQSLLSVIAPYTFLKHFKFAWVAGDPQKTYALKLGFKRENIFTGLYLADFETFESVGKQKLNNQNSFPKVFLSVARYIPQKDLPTLWNAFIKANDKNGNQWRLKCIGLGELYDQRVIHPQIEHLGFKQVDEIQEYILNSGVYVLPSIEEPWAVAVNEMALSAMPLVLSDAVGAASMFLNNSNGYLFQAGNEYELINIFDKIMNLTEDELWNMAKNSYQLAIEANKNDWNTNLNQIVKL